MQLVSVASLRFSSGNSQGNIKLYLVMSNHYPTPISIAGSFEENLPTRKRSKALDDSYSRVNSDANVTQSEKAMEKLLWNSRQAQESTSESGSKDELSVTESFTGMTMDPKCVEQELRVWGYMLSNASEYLSFLLSKESRCGSKNAVWRNSAYVNKAEGVILKDYNGDNVASSGYLIGRDGECDVVIDLPGISDRHCVLFKINVSNTHHGHCDSEADDTNAFSRVRQLVYLQDISGRGTFVNSKLLRRNEIILLSDHDTISLSANGPSWSYRSIRAVRHESFHEKFEIGRTIGRGHFAEVFEVVARSSGQKFAAKMIKKKKIKDEKTFLQEIGLLMACTHPLITCIRDVFDVGDDIYLVLELAAGGELFDRIIKKGRFSENETRHVFRQLFAALQYLHQHSIVHRDIKPENILLTSEESMEIRLADFGLAKIIGNSSSTSTLAGTPSYIPPEMLATPKTGSSLQYSKKVDSWSAGVVLYICLCGFPPFSPELAPPPMKQQIKEGNYQFQRPYWDTISDAAIDLVQRLLTVDPHSRYSISQAMEHPFMSGEPPVLRQTDDVPTEHRPSPKVIPRGVKRSRTMLKDLGRPAITD